MREFLARHDLKLGSAAFLRDLSDADLIEVYALNHQQIFRSPAYLKVTSYDLETLLVTPWPDLCERQNEIKKALLQTFGVVLSERLGVWNDPPPSPHLVCESFDGQSRWLRYNLRRVGVVLDATLNEPMGYATVIRMSPVPPATGIRVPQKV